MPLNDQQKGKIKLLDIQKEIEAILEISIFSELREPNVASNPILYQFYWYVLYQNQEIDHWKGDQAGFFKDYIGTVEPYVNARDMVDYEIKQPVLVDGIPRMITIIKADEKVAKNVVNLNLGRHLIPKKPTDKITEKEFREQLPSFSEVNEHIKSLIIKNIDPKFFNPDEFVNIGISHGLTKESAEQFSSILQAELTKANEEEAPKALTNFSAQESFSAEYISDLEDQTKKGDPYACLKLAHCYWETDKKVEAIDLFLRAERLGFVAAFNFMVKLYNSKGVSEEAMLEIVLILKERCYLDANGRLIDLEKLKELVNETQNSNILANIYLRKGILFLNDEHYISAARNFVLSTEYCRDLGGSVAFNYLSRLVESKELPEIAMQVATIYRNRRQEKNAVEYAKLALQRFQEKMKNISESTLPEVHEKIGEVCSLLYDITNDKAYRDIAISSYKFVAEFLSLGISEQTMVADKVQLEKRCAELYEKIFALDNMISMLDSAIACWDRIFSLASDKQKYIDPLGFCRLSLYKSGTLRFTKYRIEIGTESKSLYFKNNSELLFSSIFRLVRAKVYSLVMGLEDDLWAQTKITIKQMIDFHNIAVSYGLGLAYHERSKDSAMSTVISNQLSIKAKQYLESAYQAGHLEAAYWLGEVLLCQKEVISARKYFYWVAESKDAVVETYKHRANLQLYRLINISQTESLDIKEIQKLVEMLLVAAEAGHESSITELEKEYFFNVVGKFDKDKQREIFRTVAEILLKSKRNKATLKCLVWSLQYQDEKSFADMEKIMQLLMLGIDLSIKDFDHEYSKNNETINIICSAINILKIVSIQKSGKSSNLIRGNAYDSLVVNYESFRTRIKKSISPLPYIVKVTLKKVAETLGDALQEISEKRLIINMIEQNRYFFNFVECCVEYIQSYDDDKVNVLKLIKKPEVVKNTICCSRIEGGIFDDYVRIVKDNISPEEANSLIKVLLTQVENNEDFLSKKITLLCTLQLLGKNPEFYYEINTVCISLTSILLHLIDTKATDLLEEGTKSLTKSLTYTASLIDDIFYRQFQQRLPSWEICKTLAITHWARLELRNDTCLGYLKDVAKEEDQAKYKLGQLYRTAALQSERVKAVEYFFALIDGFTYEKDGGEKLRGDAVINLTTMASSYNDLHNQYEYPPKVRRDIYLKLALSLLETHNVEWVVEWFKRAILLEYEINSMSDVGLSKLEQAVMYIIVRGNKSIKSHFGKLFYDLAMFYRTKCPLSEQRCYARIFMLDCREILEDKTKDHIRITDPAVLRNLKLFFFINKLSKWKDEAIKLFNSKRTSPAEKLSAQQENLIADIDLVRRLIDALQQCMRNDEAPALSKSDGTKISLKDDTEIRAFIEEVKNGKSSGLNGYISLGKLFAAYDEKFLLQQQNSIFSRWFG